MDIAQKIGTLGIVPVIKIKDAAQAVPLCRALQNGGLPVAEITFRTDAAAQSIKNVAAELPGVLVGAGTVLSPAQVDQAIEAGAKFIVTPGFNPDVVGRCVERGIPIFPGCPTTSDIERAIGFGLKIVKFFPAEAMGGLDVIKAVSAPYGDVKFMPTGGITEDNMNQYLAFDKVVACGGSWLAPEKLIDAGDFAAIEEITRKTVRKMLGFELKHVGVNCPDAVKALAVANAFAALFGWSVKDGNSSAFAGTQVEAMKGQGLGKNGHIAVGCNSVVRAQAYLEGQGFEFLPDSAKVKDGKLVAIYLKEEIGGFAVHLVGN